MLSPLKTRKRKIVNLILKLRKKIPKVISIMLGIFLIIIVINALPLLAYYERPKAFITSSLSQNGTNNDSETSLINNNKGCVIPQLDPFEESIKKFLLPPPKIKCSLRYTSLFESDLDSSIISIPQNSKYNSRECCYQELLDKSSETDYKYGNYENHYIVKDECINVKSNVTLIPKNYETILLKCPLPGSKNKVSNDIFRFIRVKPQIEKRVLEMKKSASERKVSSDYNVVILGFDAVSHMQFIRALPKARKYLLNTLNAIELNGAAKNGENTFPNIMPLLTGMDVDELKKDCWINEGYFDNCTFIWDDFKKNGFYTSYAEDGNDIGLFTLDKKGFRKSPVDYGNGFFRQMDLFIGNNHPNNSHLCHGAKLAYQSILDNLKLIANFMGKSRRYFGYNWVNSLFHDNLERSLLGDNALRETLEWMKAKGHFNTTIFLLMSDHGIRTGPLRETTQGSLEDRMPFMYFIFPDEFKEKYPLAIDTLKNNTRRLTTHFDLHETLKDFLDLRKITDENLLTRTNELTNRGISLFLPIPEDRNCQSCGIPDEFCFCNSKISFPIGSDDAKKGIFLLVGEMNLLIKNSLNKCASLKVKEIVSIQRIYHNYTSALKEEQKGQLLLSEKYQVAFRTIPGTGHFDMLITKENNIWKFGEVIRTSQYSQESKCVADSKDVVLKKICFCN